MNSLKENDKVNFGQQAGMRFASLTQMPPPNLYFAEILPNIDGRRWHFAYSLDNEPK